MIINAAEAVHAAADFPLWEALVVVSTIALTIVTSAAVLVAVRQEHGQQARTAAEEHRHHEIAEQEAHRHAERMAELDAEADKAAARTEEALATLIRQLADIRPAAPSTDVEPTTPAS